MATESAFATEQSLVIDQKFRRKLERELKTSIVEEDTRQRVEAMKKRAIVSSRSYDEFRHLVACANDGLTHMKGTELQDGLQFKATIDERGGYNSAVLKENSGGIVSKHSAATRGAARRRAARAARSASVDAEAAARNPHLFAREWRRASEHREGDARRVELRCELLCGIKTKRIKRLFSADVDSQLLGEIVETLCDALSLREERASPSPAADAAGAPTAQSGTELPPTPPAGGAEGAAEGAAASDAAGVADAAPPIMTAKRALKIVGALADTGRCGLSAEFLGEEQRAAAAALLQFGAVSDLITAERHGELNAVFGLA